MGLDGFIRLMTDRTDVKVGLQGFKDALTSSISSTPNTLRRPLCTDK